MTRKKCVICGERPATVPDRERMGRPINRLCTDCHGARLVGDMKFLQAAREKKLAKLAPEEE